MRSLFQTAPVRSALCLAAPFLLASLPAADGAEVKTKVAIVAFGLNGDQSVFESEAKKAAKIAADGFGSSSVTVHANTKRSGDVNAATVATALKSAAESLDPEHDVLFVILTSHGDQSGLEVKAGGHEETLSPLALVKALDDAPAHYRVIIISACYSGVFVRPLADSNTLVITAADADHSSFGCRNGNDWTYFGNAFFNTALRHTSDLRAAFAEASAVVRKRERRKHLTPSNPQMSGGENVERVLKGEIDKIVEEARDGGGLDPKYAFARGMASGVRDDYVEAIAAYSEAIKFDPKYPIAYNNRGVAYFKTGDNDHAIADYTETIKLNPKVASPYSNRGRAWRANGDNDHAIADYTKAISIDSKYADAYTYRGQAYGAKGDHDRAIADYTMAIKLDAKSQDKSADKTAAAYNSRGLAYAAKRDNDRAIADYSEAIRLDPKLANAYENRGHAYHAKGDDERAARDFDDAIRLDPKLAPALGTISMKP
jgi:tetratricopeptide (TPR) repeat protein